jgi:hypothetical protein
LLKTGFDSTMTKLHRIRMKGPNHSGPVFRAVLLVDLPDSLRFAVAEHARFDSYTSLHGRIGNGTNTTASLAIQAQPDLATAYFLRGWATYLTHKHDPQLLADIIHAAQLAPTEPLFTNSLLYLQRHTP